MTPDDRRFGAASYKVGSVNVLIATSGVLTPAAAADLVERLVRDGDKVNVVTVMEVPRSFLDEVRSDEWQPDESGNAIFEQSEESLIARYVEERGRRITEPMIEELAERGVDAHATFLEGDDPAATIIGAAADLAVDIVVMGATRMIFQGWESVSARVMAEAAVPVLVVPSPKVEVDEETE